MKEKISTLIVVLIIIIGILLLLYPTVSNWWNQKHQSQAIGTYIEKIEEKSKENYTSLLKKAREYNMDLSKKSFERFHLSQEEKKAYDSFLKVPGSDVMSLVEIPKLNIMLPIYHGTDQAVLQVALGHIAGTSLPIGGQGTHSVISGHTGLESARLFTDIDKLKIGDIFTLTTLGQTLTYQVDQIRVVLPNELDFLKIEEDKDLVSLQTCTPYGINTHRLLVRAERINAGDKELKVVPDLVAISKPTQLVITSIFVFSLFVVVKLFLFISKKIMS